MVNTSYGLLVKHMSASSPPSTFSNVSEDLASPQHTRCSPQIHRSPGLLIGSSGWLGSFVWIGVQRELDDEQPVKFVLIQTGERRTPKPATCRSTSSSRSSSSLHSPDSVSLLSAIA